MRVMILTEPQREALVARVIEETLRELAERPELLDEPWEVVVGIAQANMERRGALDMVPSRNGED